MQIPEMQEKISPILSKYGIERAAVFGSVARGEDVPKSDVDLLIKLGEQPMGMIKYMELIEEIEQSLGRKVDIITEGSDKFLRPYIEKEMKVIYER